PLSAYETDHAAEDPHELGDDERGNHGRAVCRRTGAPRGGADAGDRPMNADRPVIESLPEILVEPIVRAALAEDLGRAGDITTTAVVPASARFRGVVTARQPGTVAGIGVAALAFRLMDPEV